MFFNLILLIYNLIILCNFIINIYCIKLFTLNMYFSLFKYTLNINYIIY